MSMTLIATATVGSGGASGMTFSSIPASFTDLLVVVAARNSGSNISNSLYIRFNGDAGNNYTNRILSGNGSTVTSSRNSSNSFMNIGDDPGANATSNTFGNTSVYIPNYAGSTNKSVSSDAVTENNATTASQQILASIWNNTSAITSIFVSDTGSNLVQNSTASLYGILRGAGGATVS